MRPLEASPNLIPIWVRSGVLLRMNYRFSTLINFFWKDDLGVLICTLGGSLQWELLSKKAHRWALLRAPRLWRARARARAWAWYWVEPNLTCEPKSLNGLGL